MFAQTNWGKDLEADRLREVDVGNENLHAHDAEKQRLVTRFRESRASLLVLRFLSGLNNAVIGRSNSTAPQDPSPGVRRILVALETVGSIVEATPPITTPSRFGNPAFRTFLQSIQDSAVSTMQLVLGDSVSPACIGEGCDPSSSSVAVAEELAKYWVASWGDMRRIDYGTGHELNFVLWLLTLQLAGVVSATPSSSLDCVGSSSSSVLELATAPLPALAGVVDDSASLVLSVFTRYLSIVRQLQMKYSLEPAGSRGVWGLDDFHFLPFLFGSAQLIGHKHIRPRSVRYQEIFENFSHEYMYLDCIRFVHSIKLRSFAEHSPLLDDITAVQTWQKVNAGLWRMYRADVLGKFAVVQHFIYSHFLPDTPCDESAALLRAELAEREERHARIASQRGGASAALLLASQAACTSLPCCCDAIHFPSAVGARRAPSSM